MRSFKSKPNLKYQKSPIELVDDFYRNYYQDVFCSGGVVGKSYDHTHKMLERKFRTNRNLAILEFGAGTGEHLSFVKPDFESYTMLDLRPAPEGPEWQGDDRVTWLQQDIGFLPNEGVKYDRILCTCVMHHLDNPAAALASIRGSLKPGGTFSLFLPSDPGVLVRINRRLFVERRARKLGFEAYGIVNAYEHRNHYWSLKTLIESTFCDFEIRKVYFPFFIPAGNLSTFSIWHIS